LCYDRDDRVVQGIIVQQLKLSYEKYLVIKTEKLNSLYVQLRDFKVLIPRHFDCA
jgi:hypothetical protein